MIEEVEVAAPSPEVAPGDAFPEILTPQVFDLVILFARSDHDVPERSRGRVRAVRPDGVEAVPQEFDIDLTQFARSRMIVKIPGIPVAGEGIYRFLVDCANDNSEWTIPFEVPMRIMLQIPGSG